MFGFRQNPTSEIQPALLGCSVTASGKGEGDDPKAHVPVAPARFLSLVPGGMLAVSGQDEAGCPAACPRATEPPFPWILGTRYCLSEQKSAPFPGEGIPAQVPVCKGILTLPCPRRLQPLSCLSPSAQGRKGVHRSPFPSSTGTALYPKPSKAIHRNVSI